MSDQPPKLPFKAIFVKSSSGPLPTFVHGAANGSKEPISPIFGDAAKDCFVDLTSTVCELNIVSTRIRKTAL